MVERSGRRLRVLPADAPPKLSRAVRREHTILGDPEELVHIDWSGEWRP